jgi:2-polyprenyl-6-methoxyphenol hydroxylase-like FAD-dependent oxidoreductase
MAGQGASQAIEDAAVLAISLELAGKKNVPLGLRAAEKIRLIHPSLRVSCCLGY